MFHKRPYPMLALLVVVSFVVGACAPATPEVVVQTSPPEEVEVEVTRIVAGTPVVETVIITATPEPEPTKQPVSEDNPIQMRIGVAMTAPELESWLPLIEELDQAHPEWILITEQTPQASRLEKINANVAAGTLPDIQMMGGLEFNPYVRQGAFLALDDYIAQYDVDMTDFPEHVLSEWQWDGKTWGMPNTAAPSALYINVDKFEEAGIPVPTGDITYDELRDLAIRMTFDANGNTPLDEGFDPDNIVQWGWPAHMGAIGIWGNDSVEPWGGDFCANEECSRVSMTDPEDLEAINFWYDLVVTNHAVPEDVFGGTSTGVPGDPFTNGFTPMGSSGYFLLGQIAAAGNFQVAVLEVPIGPNGRASALSTNGYAIAANAPYPEEAFKLIMALTSTDFLTRMWALPGHSVPSRRSAAQSILQLSDKLGNMQAFLNALEYGRGFRPNGPGAFEAFFASLEHTQAVFRGELTPEEGYRLAEEAANAVLEQHQP